MYDGNWRVSYFVACLSGKRSMTLQHATTHYNTLQYTATYYNALQCTATCCNTLQHAATRCNTLQHTARTPQWQAANDTVWSVEGSFLRVSAHTGHFSKWSVYSRRSPPRTTMPFVQQLQGVCVWVCVCGCAGVWDCVCGKREREGVCMCVCGCVYMCVPPVRRR